MGLSKPRAVKGPMKNLAPPVGAVDAQQITPPGLQPGFKVKLPIKPPSKKKQALMF